MFQNRRTTRRVYLLFVLHTTAQHRLALAPTALDCQWQGRHDVTWSGDFWPAGLTRSDYVDVAALLLPHTGQVTLSQSLRGVQDLHCWMFQYCKIRIERDQNLFFSISTNCSITDNSVRLSAVSCKVSFFLFLTTNYKCDDMFVGRKRNSPQWVLSCSLRVPSTPASCGRNVKYWQFSRRGPRRPETDFSYSALAGRKQT